MIVIPADTDSPGSAVPSWRRVWSAPWRGIVRPEVAARDLVAGSRLAFTSTFVFLTILFATSVTALRLWAETVEPVFGVNVEVRVRSVTEVWRDWYGVGPIGTAGQTAATTAFVFILATAFVTWLLFPYAHMGGSLWRTYRRIFRAVLGSAGLCLLLIVAHGALFVLTLHVVFRAIAIGSGVDWRLAMIPALVPGSACWMVWWINRAVRAVRPPVPERESSPSCEGCGYDLTHQPASGRCSECDYSLDDSLAPGRKRSGSAWERRPGIASWCRTSVDTLLHAERFYDTLPVRTPDDDARCFARWHYALIGCHAALCFFLADQAPSASKTGDMLISAVVAMFGWPLLAWVALHGNATLVIFWWAARGSRLRLYLTRKILCYEAAYLSCASIAAAILFASFMKYGLWITDALGREFFVRVFNTEAESVVIVAGITIASGIWHWRITLAIRAVRWSNF